MGIKDQETFSRQQFDKAIIDLTKIDLKELVREELGNELNFKDGRSYFERILEMFREISEIDSDKISQGQLLELAGIIRAVNTLFNSVRSFSIQRHAQNPVQARNELISKIQQEHDNVFKVLGPIITYYLNKAGGVARLEELAQKSVSNLDKIISEQMKSQSAMLAEVESTLDKIKRAAEEVGVSQHAIHFKQEADEHKRSASKWLGATALLAVATLLIAGGSLYRLIEQLPLLDLPKSLQLMVAKLIVFSLLFSGIIWMGRVYRAHRHNYVVNKHRQNALSTFETFVKAANDDQTRSAVLLQATSCIFSQQHTGYISQDTDAAGYPQILEIVRGVAGSHSKSQ